WTLIIRTFQHLTLPTLLKGLVTPETEPYARRIRVNSHTIQPWTIHWEYARPPDVPYSNVGRIRRSVRFIRRLSRCCHELVNRGGVSGWALVGNCSNPTVGWPRHGLRCNHRVPEAA